MAVGFAVTENNNWSNSSFLDTGGFPDDVLQHYLLDYFTVDGVRVDPYDGALFSSAQLGILIPQLEHAVTHISAQPADWPFESPEQVAAFHERCRIYHIEHLSPRDHSLKTLTRAIELSRLARARRESLAFIGD